MTGNGGGRVGFRRRSTSLGPGFEAFGEIEISIELGFLFGLTDATPDNAFKFNLEYERPGRRGDEVADDGDEDEDGDDD